MFGEGERIKVNKQNKKRGGEYIFERREGEGGWVCLLKRFRARACCCLGGRAPGPWSRCRSQNGSPGAPVFLLCSSNHLFLFSSSSIAVLSVLEWYRLNCLSDGRLLLFGAVWCNGSSLGFSGIRFVTTFGVMSSLLGLLMWSILLISSAFICWCHTEVHLNQGKRN